MKRNRVDDEAVYTSGTKHMKVEEGHYNKDMPIGSDEVWQCLKYLQSQFPVDGFQTDPPLPPIVLQHQLYSLTEDRTSVDRELMLLRDSGEVRIFQVGVAGVDYAVVEKDHYYSYLRQYFEKRGCLGKLQHFMKHILPACTDVSVSDRQLKTEFRMTEGQISDLVRCGVLLVRGVASGRSWWFSIPGLSPFTRSLSQGRRQLKQCLQRARYNELLQSELEGRRWRTSQLSIHYHLHDIIGSDVVERVDSTSAPLLRLVQESR